jgi:membrane fusion protein (multidrug efflux system)
MLDGDWSSDVCSSDLYKVAEIRPQVSGIILSRLFEEGSYVKAGQQLYQIDPATYQAAYESAQADLLKAEANLKAVAPQAERYSELVKIGGVSKQDYDNVAASLAQAKASIASSKAAVKTAKINLDYTKVFAPISGRIGKSSVTEGALVTASQATALATIQNLDKIYVDVSQPSADVMKMRKQIKEGKNPEAAKVDIILDGETDSNGVKGTVQFSDVTVDETTGMVELRILVPNSEELLLPGLFVKARIVQDVLDNAMTIPQQAVSRNPDGTVMVWVVGEGDIVNPRVIEVSKAINDKWLVSKGLSAGDRVVVAGLQKIRENAKVAPVEMGNGAAKQQ